MGKVNLCIDIGNTSTKAALFQDGELTTYFSNLSWEEFNKLRVSKKPRILACQSGSDNAISLQLSKEEKLSYLTPLPMDLEYDTPETVGMDRLAACVACGSEFPSATILKVDLGTCLTLDMVHKKTFKGGLIAPGIEMRLKAMHEFTAALPIVPLNMEAKFPGKSTFESMQVGACQSIAYEIRGYIEAAILEYDDVVVVDCSRHPIDFAKDLKIKIFARPKNTLVGLNKIIEHNAN